MNKSSNSYYNGFVETSINYGIDPEGLAKFAMDYSRSQDMTKKAGLNYKILRALASLRRPFHRELDPNKLNWFTKLFTTTRDLPKDIRLSGLRASKISPGSPNTGYYGDLSSLNGDKYKLESLYESLNRKSTRLDPMKVLAALGLTAGSAGTAVGLNRNNDNKSKNDSQIPTQSDYPISTKLKLLGASLGLAGIGGTGLYALNKKNKKKNRKNQDEQDA